MNRFLFLGLLVVGVVLLVLGVSEANSISSGFSRLFTGGPTDKTVWLLIGGALASAVAVGGLARGFK